MRSICHCKQKENRLHLKRAKLRRQELALAAGFSGARASVLLAARATSSAGQLMCFAEKDEIQQASHPITAIFIHLAENED